MVRTETFEHLGHTFTLEAHPTEDGSRWEGFFSTRIPDGDNDIEHRKKIRATTSSPEEALNLARIGAQYFLETME